MLFSLIVLVATGILITSFTVIQTLFCDGKGTHYEKLWFNGSDLDFLLRPFSALSRFLVKLSSTKMLHGWIWKQTRIRKASFRSIYYRGLYREYFLPNFSKNGKWKLIKDRDRAIVEVIIATSKLDFLVAKTKATTKKIFSDCLVSEYFCTLLCKTIDLWSPDGAYEYFNL